ncbi:MAG: AraC family transcriptional regulator [Chthoniobacterales bacterium]
MYIYGGIGDTGPWHRYRRYPGLPFWIFAIQRSGSYVIHHSDGTKIEHNPPDLLLIEPNTTYEVFGRNQPLRGLLWLYFTPPVTMEPLLRLPLVAAGIRLLPIHNRALWKEMQKAARSVVDSFSPLFSEQEVLAMNALERVFLMVQPLINKSVGGGMPQDPRILKVAEEIRQHPENRWTVRELAKSVNMSVTNLAHRFTEEMHLPPMRYVDTQRIERAKSLLLNSNALISEISERLGYSSPYHFSNRFRKIVGKSPRTFRNNPEDSALLG